jgi:hypothetical protein
MEVYGVPATAGLRAAFEEARTNLNEAVRLEIDGWWLLLIRPRLSLVHAIGDSAEAPSATRLLSMRNCLRPIRFPIGCEPPVE